MLLTIRRSSIVLVLLLGYIYFRKIGEFYALVSIGMISFALVAQFAPAILGGIFWKGATRTGAVAACWPGLRCGSTPFFYPRWCRPASFPRILLPRGHSASPC